ncbi:hypothetical protein OHJ21_07200 [Virgibacillus sp. LDC1]|uniref:hypothetical protein n=1 Tax=Paenibacillus TaxID=44249 RepID=UPI000C27D6B8|nr:MULTISPECIES: hypothetical protein [Paenibacillus]MCV4230957.1 hypothetical protein [Virgibacillus sp. LDC1]MEC0258729.1 hypothetical protein [Paenibacillus lautus]MEC0311033.1 hypothetical protein [Paenibacillus lautus]PJN54794.1 hypothetical protein PAEVO_15150 [Paenibacillus sp. GM2FR]
MEFVGIFMTVLSIVVAIIVIRYAINSSKIIIRMDAMLQEMRMLRKDVNELKENKHIVDKRA